MPENVTRNAETKWSPAAVQKLTELWAAHVPVALIAQTLGRPAHEVSGKAVELKLSRDTAR